MSDGKRELRLAFERVEQEVPKRLASMIRWLRHPGSCWVRIPVGVLLLIGGIFSFLPFLGIWMLPLGLMLIAADMPVLRKPMARCAFAGLAFWTWLRRRLRR
ncbi:conserved hypothetical protein [Hyphomicrobiales bacterium]|nr:conserved hypothetical protein [Hyphomicrobiales bacterium]CAH1694694.1 conserved hypothetical protein [Hyphomicrobiales bacterium]